MSALQILCGDAMEQLRLLPPESVQCCVTSPPYWGLRDYSCEGQLGLEKTPEEYVAGMVEVFREVRRVLRPDGTLWLNLGDSYAGSMKGEGGTYELSAKQNSNRGSHYGKDNGEKHTFDHGLKPKDLCGIPWRVAFALQKDGWWLRSDIIWAKPNPMPESVTDRPTKSHEYLFLLTKNSSYYYDSEAIREPVKTHAIESLMSAPGELTDKDKQRRDMAHAIWGGNQMSRSQNQIFRGYETICGANKRSVWTVATAPYPEAHFATYPPDLVKPCIMAGTSAKGCCAKCGAPWERKIERVDSGRTQKMADGWDTGDGAHGTIHRNGREKGESGIPIMENKTIGWQPTCKHFDSSMGGGGTSFKGHSGHLKADGSPIAPPRETIGWEQTCDCNSEVIPCTVLDPFAGSGTTGMVALELGRRAVLIELNPKYVELIERRCNVTPGLALA